MKPFRVGFVQSRPRFGAVAANLQSCLELMAGKRADLWVLPELATSGYVFRSKRELAAAAEPLPDGPSCRRLREFARENDTAVVAGLPERAGKRFFNSAVLIVGNSVVTVSGHSCVYRKVHLFDAEKRFFSPGNLGFPLATVKGVKVGMMVCFDWFFPEACRTLALKGAQVIAHPANLVLPWGPEAMRTRSLENRVFAVTADRVGRERGLRFIGRSQVVGTRGEILARASGLETGSTVVEIDPGLALRKRLNPRNDLFRDRRPSAYRL